MRSMWYRHQLPTQQATTDRNVDWPEHGAAGLEACHRHRRQPPHQREWPSLIDNGPWMDHMHEVEWPIVLWTERLNCGDQGDALPAAREDDRRLRLNNRRLVSIPSVPDDCLCLLHVPRLAVQHLRVERRRHGQSD